jgi:2-aminoethylphosphonate-pyruvate transaminase
VTATDKGSSRRAPGERLLFTPGPLTTDRRTRDAMTVDRGSRDDDFIALTARVRRRLIELAGADATHTCVPLQGSGTFAVEATLRTLVPRDGSIAVLVDGAYGARMAEIARTIGRRVVPWEVGETETIRPHALRDLLARDASITHVGLVHCETSTGRMHELDALLDAAGDRAVIVDAMSSFGAIAFDAGRCEAVVASANKCLEGVPGLAFALVRTSALERARGNAGSVVLDLEDQWRAMERTGQWRFTPPTHVVAALDTALDLHAREGGVAARRARYAESHRALVLGMRALGFQTVLPDVEQSPIIVAFDEPSGGAFSFERFHRALRDDGFVIYPGKLTQRASFRIGCIGAIDREDVEALLASVARARASAADVG